MIYYILTKSKSQGVKALRSIYEPMTANYPRLNTDVFFSDYANEFQFEGFIGKTIKYIEGFQYLNPVLWERFVQQFREDADFEGGWRGEYWGKSMRGAALVYSCTKNPDLYKAMTDTVESILKTQDNDGRISSYALSHEFDAWDIWGRKYVLLGLQYFLEVCEDKDLYRRVVESMCSQVDYIMTKIGCKKDGKKPITSATRHWRGLNSSSILEPVVRLYSLTGESKYLDFAQYIVSEGGMDVANVFDLAYEKKLRLWQYPATKAYEMTSCFEGLLEYYRITGEAKYKTAIVNYADLILEDEFTVIGTSGCTHELFDHSSARQANTTNGLKVQETCVTVTLMKFFWQLTLLTGDSKYADAFERALYNAYLGAVNTDKVIEPSIRETFPEEVLEPLPFDSYSPLTAGTRGNGVGGLMKMSDGHYYGCCACIGGAGLGVAAKMAVLTGRDALIMNLYIHGTVKTYSPSGKEVVIKTETKYPKFGNIKIDLYTDDEFSFFVRNPLWSKNTVIKVDGHSIDSEPGYTKIEIKGNTSVEISLDMTTSVIYPESYGSQVLMNEVIWGYNYVVPTYDEEDPLAKYHIALRRGPVILAAENRLGYSVDDPADIKVEKDGTVDAKIPEQDKAPYEHIVEVTVPLSCGGEMTLTDYASAGKLWNEKSKMAAWIRTVTPFIK